ncbi:transglutaminase domain-containing protein [Robertkochia marina]|uniref:Transglutaminase domain-containing protein n=1 Tax=Robertkochia marina TaxID=1227945 RepID=A0A4S3M4G2_9FLAO|nr:transglutaminase-like domain-containing protein [Robertkochia marina]THD69790.1 transglutaminase domain-containing protein [Robertkochia marina]TRZ46866.1 transglutaminase domain-containing protein [Robertkochia marina]
MKYIERTDSFDFDHAQIRKFIDPLKDLDTDQEKIRQVYLMVRDGWRYNPYHISFQREDFRASTIAERQDGHCIDKAILMVAMLRGVGIPSRLHLAKVTNHMAVDRLIEKLGSDELAPHGMVDVYHKGAWLKASPTFNKELCDKFGVDPVDFDGSADALLQPYDARGEVFMEYLEDYGHFEDVPYEFILNTFKENYPEMYAAYKDQGRVRF